MTTIATVIADLQTAIADAQAIGAAQVVRDLELAVSDAQSLVIVSPPIARVALDLAALVRIVDQYPGDRYSRFANHTVITTSAFSLAFGAIDQAAGGSHIALAYPSYGLRLGGVERARYTVASGQTGGIFAGTLADEPDGPIYCEIVAYDSLGNVVSNPVESLVPYWIWIDRNGEAKNCPDVIFQTNSFEWDRVNPVYAWCRLPKTSLGNQVLPVTPAVRTPFSTALPPTSITRLDLVPATGSNQSQTHYPVTTSRGIVVTDNLQAYFREDFSRDPVRLPLLDGPRGIATVSMTTFLKTGRNGKVFGCDSHAFWMVDATGTKTTLAGLRHTQAPYWGDTAAARPFAETVGTWDASIPAAEQFPWESWGMCWNIPSLALDPLHAPIGGEQPHLMPGPVAYVTDRHGYILKLQFNGENHSAPPVVTRFAALDDPWGVDTDGSVLYVAERGKHRISIYNQSTGAWISDVLSNPTGGTLCVFDPPSQPTHDAHLAPGITLAQARAATIVAPEVMVLQDGYLYWGSAVQQEIRRVNLQTFSVEVVCRPTWDQKSHFVSLCISDGTFGPRGTVFSTTFSNAYFGRPEAWLPIAGTAADGTSLTNSKKWGWHGFQRDLVRGASGASEDTNYSLACAVGDGQLVVGTASFGLDVFVQKMPTDVVPDAARASAGASYYRNNCYYLLHGNYGSGPTLCPLPWGENADCDYFLSTNLGHGP